ncbi:hypothetical protein WICPIJ_000613 [Wickerhamomyces pijperi]|uniref:Casein kinase II subunit beta n=1 Tax=Wickerhamomyces pijperi TaxID=599730 RepID=A0A9P8TRP3_WICPI|nr:hypothetical protein WICPIJ_000613 [Wickerhamomyces pijperi]
MAPEHHQFAQPQQDVDGDGDEYISDSGSDFNEQWIDWFLGIKGNEYFCDVDVDYILDKFNLTGLNTEVEKMSKVIDMITDGLDEEYEIGDKERDHLEANANKLYGLIHQRYIITTKGLNKMHLKYKNADFGYCYRVYCELQHLLPIGLSDHVGVSTVKLYCPKCEDIYNPKSSRHAQIDGAYFGTTFPGMFLQTFAAEVMPVHPVERYIPKIFGFNIHQYAKLARWQELQRNKQIKRLTESGINVANVMNGYNINPDGSPLKPPVVSSGSRSRMRSSRSDK